MKVLKSVDSVLTLIDVVHEDDDQTSLIMDYIDLENSVDLNSLSKDFGDLEIRFYMYLLLKTVDLCHKKGVILSTSALDPRNIMVID